MIEDYIYFVGTYQYFNITIKPKEYLESIQLCIISKYFR